MQSDIFNLWQFWPNSSPVETDPYLCPRVESKSIEECLPLVTSLTMSFSEVCLGDLTNVLGRNQESGSIHDHVGDTNSALCVQHDPGITVSASTGIPMQCVKSTVDVETVQLE